ncbi:hypothetical protein FQA39_LY02815 [Lamprigera yunnana]|nr:hypothetical protein FQA39_LY02815 [Lamprigera yunnana]
MSEDITKKKELVKKALFGEVIKIQLEENYTKLKTHEERKKFNKDQVIATGGDITNLNEFATVISERCPGIKVDVIEGYEIDQMNTIINDKSSEMVAFKGTLLVHQVTGTGYIPNNLTMKSLSCFCNPDGCDHYKLGSINYQTELCAKNSTRLNTSTVFSDFEDDIPLSTYVRDNDDRFELDRDKWYQELAVIRIKVVIVVVIMFWSNMSQRKQNIIMQRSALSTNAMSRSQIIVELAIKQYTESNQQSKWMAPQSNFDDHLEYLEDDGDRYEVKNDLLPIIII